MILRKMKDFTEGEWEAKKFLSKAGAQCQITRIGEVNGFPFDDADSKMHYVYSVKLRREHKTYTFKFYDSADNYYKDERPTVYDVLACVEKYEPCDDVWDFAEEFGYEINDRKSFESVSHIHKECKKQYGKLLALFGEELMDELREIY